jgi:hypothetical protein
MEGMVCHLRLADGDIFLNCYSYACIQGEHLGWQDSRPLFLTMYVLWQSYFDERPHRQARLSSIRNIVDASGLIWFVIGNIWVFGDDLTHCVHPQLSPIYEMCVAMLIINYIQICLPCIVAIALIPIFCFCMPCLIRILARMQTARAPVVGCAGISIQGNCSPVRVIYRGPPMKLFLDCQLQL